MSSSSGRAQIEPLAALAAVFAVGVGLALYAGAVDATVRTLGAERSLAPTAADRFVAAASTFGAVDPPVEDALAEARPTGHHLNATLRTPNASWRAGPAAPATAHCERRRVAVRVAPGRVRPALLEVCVWRAA
jgi:hypothetical protein